MFCRLNNHMFSILILLTSISTSVYGTSCEYYERPCSIGSFTWCCPNYQYCGYDYGVCYSSTTTPSPPSSSNFPTSVLAAIIIASSIFLITCIIFCFRAYQYHQHSRFPIVPVNTQTVPYPYQQHPVQVGHTRPVYNVGGAPSTVGTYEVPPPSYETVTANYPPKYSLAASPPVTSTV